jgi:hypothetical protein
MNLFIEAIIVGLINAIFGILISTLLMYVFSPDFTIKKYNFWPHVLFSYFITGLIIHILFEWVNMNKKFCCYRNYLC